jgi:hypothetical protein
VIRTAAAILAWLRRALARTLRTRQQGLRYTVVRVAGRAELPDPLPPGVLHVVGEPAKWAVLNCPCGSSHTLDINLAAPGRRRWTLSGPAEAPSVRPSVNYADGERRCHFWIIDGVLRWCGDTWPCPVRDLQAR